MDPALLSRACSLYRTSSELLTPLSGGHFNAVYQFPLPETLQASVASQASETWTIPPAQKFGILRIGVEDCPSEQTLSMLDFMHYLNRQGAPVVAPLLSINDQLLESIDIEGQRYNLTAFEKAAGTLAEDIPPSLWTDDLFRSIGIAVGKLHNISAGFTPTLPGFTRPQWFDTFELHEASRLLATSSDPGHERLMRLLIELKRLPISVKDYGIIHGDLHFANFLVHEGGQVSVIDFDDCVFGWFAMDVAMALFDVLVLYNPSGEEESQRFAQNFMRCYLSGYRQARDLSPFWLSQIPRFLKLLELCIYATLVNHTDVALPDSWVGRFMRGRAERIASDKPYVEIDFAFY